MHQPAQPICLTSSTAASSACLPSRPFTVSLQGSAPEGVEFEADYYECINPQSPTGVGAVDLLSYSSAPFTLHSVTPPRQVGTNQWWEGWGAEASGVCGRPAVCMWAGT